MSTVQPITSGQFVVHVVQSELPVVVDFYATWCPPCRALAPVLEQLAVELAGQVRFVKVNIDKDGILADRLRVDSVPTLLVFHAGQVVDRLTGLQSSATLRQRLGAVLARTSRRSTSVGRSGR